MAEPNSLSWNVPADSALSGVTDTLGGEGRLSSAPPQGFLTWAIIRCVPQSDVSATNFGLQSVIF